MSQFLQDLNPSPIVAWPSNHPGLSASLHHRRGQAVMPACVQAACDRALPIGLLKVLDMNC